MLSLPLVEVHLIVARVCHCSTLHDLLSHIGQISKTLFDTRQAFMEHFSVLFVMLVMHLVCILSTAVIIFWLLNWYSFQESKQAVDSYGIKAICPALSGANRTETLYEIHS